jgi:hypothetical protein
MSKFEERGSLVPSSKGDKLCKDCNADNNDKCTDCHPRCHKCTDYHPRCYKCKFCCDDRQVCVDEGVCVVIPDDPLIVDLYAPCCRAFEEDAK